MILSLIAAIGKNNALGINNKLLWNLPSDMKHFRDITSGHTVIMGWKTYQSIGRLLPNRKNIIISSDPNSTVAGADIVSSLDDAFKLASLEQGRKFEENQEEVEVFIIGGGKTYSLAMPKATKLYITEVEDSPEADTFFPEINNEEWKEISREKHGADPQNLFSYSFVVYTRK